MTSLPSSSLLAEELSALATALECQYGQEDRNVRKEQEVDYFAEILSLPTREEVLACQFSSWYPVFSNLPVNNLDRKNVTIKAVIIDLPESFREYLIADGVDLPDGACVSSGLMMDAPPADWSSDTDDDSSCDDRVAVAAEHNKTSNEDDNGNSGSFSFPALDEKIREAIAALGGGVVPKLNWSCPKDAVWINSGSLKCATPGDVYLLLKSSDFCSYDVHLALREVAAAPENSANLHNETTTTASDVDPPLQLALRKWCNLYPSQEFRCFVCHEKLIAISQRQSSQYYPHVVSHRAHFQSLIIEFFDCILSSSRKATTNQDVDGTNYNNNEKQQQEQLPTINQQHPYQLPDKYVFDVYIDKKDRVWLLDINVWGRRTDALLFTWSELVAMTKHEDDDNNNVNESDDNNNTKSTSRPELRIVETGGQVRADPLSSYRAPIDVVHVASEFEAFMKLCKPQSVLDAEEVQRQQVELQRLDGKYDDDHNDA